MEYNEKATSRLLLVRLIALIILVVIISSVLKKSDSSTSTVETSSQETSGGSIINRVGSSVPGSENYLKETDDALYVKVNDDWLDSSKVSYNVFQPSYIEYEGKRIFVGENAVINTIKALTGLGLIQEAK
jgi:hypothetical protein